MNYMVGMSAVLGIAAVAFGISLIPGPNMFYLASRSITQGRGAGLISLAGVAVGFGVYLGAAVAGLAAVFAVVPVAYTMLKVAGGVFMNPRTGVDEVGEIVSGIARTATAH